MQLILLRLYRIRADGHLFRHRRACELHFMFFANLESSSFTQAIVPAAGPRNDLHVYDPASMTWFDLTSHAHGQPPTARSGHGFASVGGKLYVHGGFNGQGA
jgi:hypothetical protein